MNWKFIFNNRGTSETTSTTITETIPTAISAALLEMAETNVVQPLVTTYPFPGPGLVHNTPIVSKLWSRFLRTLFTCLCIPLRSEGCITIRVVPATCQTTKIMPDFLTTIVFVFISLRD